MRFSAVVTAAALLFVADAALASFGGCVISPENPTVILGALGAGAASFPWLKACIQNRLAKRGE